MSEFIGGNNDTCGPDAEVSALHAIDNNYPLTAGQMSAIRKRDIVAGWFNSPTNGPGIIINHIKDDLLQFEHVAIIDYIPLDTSGSSVADIHNALVSHAGTFPAILQIMDARKLPGNEQSANPIIHFVAILGIDSVQGYAVANGDDINALNGQATYPIRWIGWPDILAAQPVGLVVFDRTHAPVTMFIDHFKKDTNNVWTDLRNNNTVGDGIMQAAIKLGLDESFILLYPEEIFNPSQVREVNQPFDVSAAFGNSNSDVLIVWGYSKNSAGIWVGGPTVNWSGHVAFWYRYRMGQAIQQVKDLAEQNASLLNNIKTLQATMGNPEDSALLDQLATILKKRGL